MKLMTAGLIGLLFILFLSESILGQSILEKPLRPVTPVTTDTIRLVDQQLICQGSYGAQTPWFQLGGKNVRSEKTTAVFVPDFNLQDNVMVSFGCRQQQFFVDYTLNSGTMRFREDLTVRGKDYNSIEYENSLYSLGYQFSLIPDSLYVGTGIGFYQLRYTLGMYGENESEEYSATEKSDSGWGGLLDVRWFINHFFAVDYRVYKTVSNDNILSGSSRVGLNFYSRF